MGLANAGDVRAAVDRALDAGLGRVLVLVSGRQRLLIRQTVGLAHLLPVAVEVLRVAPQAEGDMYEGDLLAAVLTARDAEVWSESPELMREVRSIVSELTDVPPALKREVKEFIALQVADSLPSLTGRLPTRITERGVVGRSVSQHGPGGAGGP